MEKIIYLLAVAFVCTSANTVPVDDDLSGRITDGYLAANGQFPYAVSLQRIAGNINIPTRGHVCGGVMFTLQHLLTAGSCTFVYSTNITQPPVAITTSEYRVFAGTILTSDTNINVTRTIANFTLHPSYSGAPAYINNIAIITLVSPFPNTVVTPLPLPAINFNPTDNTECTVAGWGSTHYAQTMPSTQLLFTRKYIYNQNLCASIFNPDVYFINIRHTMVCAASENIISTGCWGDLGNALVCDGRLTGILFMSDYCQQSSLPELYTRVSNYTTWIRSVTGSASTFKPEAITVLLFTIFYTAFHKILME